MKAKIKNKEIKIFKKQKCKKKKYRKKNRENKTWQTVLLQKMWWCQRELGLSLRTQIKRITHVLLSTLVFMCAIQDDFCLTPSCMLCFVKEREKHIHPFPGLSRSILLSVSTGPSLYPSQDSPDSTVSSCSQTYLSPQAQCLQKQWIISKRLLEE